MPIKATTPTTRARIAISTAACPLFVMITSVLMLFEWIYQGSASLWHPFPWLKYACNYMQEIGHIGIPIELAQEVGKFNLVHSKLFVLLNHHLGNQGGTLDVLFVSRLGQYM